MFIFSNLWVFILKSLPHYSSNYPNGVVTLHSPFWYLDYTLIIGARFSLRITLVFIVYRFSVSLV